MYTLINRVLSCSGNSVSRKSMVPSGFVCSALNRIAWSMLLICYRKFSFCFVYCMTKVSSTYILHNLSGFSAVVRTISSKYSCYKLVTMRLTGVHMATPLLVQRTAAGERNIYCEYRTLDAV